MFVATLDGIFKYPDIPEEYEPYVQFKATIRSGIAYIMVF